MFENLRRVNSQADLTHSIGMLPYYRNERFFTFERLARWVWRPVTAWVAVCFGLLFVIYLVASYNYHLKKEFEKAKDYFAYAQSFSESQVIEKQLQIARLYAMQNADMAHSVKAASTITTILGTTQGSQREFLEKLLPHALVVGVAYQIPPSAIAGMAIYESGYGTSELARQHHNYFGMKAFDTTWSGSTAQNVSTVDSGVPTTADFRSYPNVQEGVIGFAEFVCRSNRYQSAFEFSNGPEFVRVLNTNGYCPDRDYTERVSEIILRHRLDLLDEIALESPKPSKTPDLAETASTVPVLN